MAWALAAPSFFELILPPGVGCPHRVAMNTTSAQPAITPNPSPSPASATAWHVGLTPKEVAFIEHVIKGNTLAASALKAGYAKKSVRRRGYELNKRPHIQAAIQKLMATAAARIDITANSILQEVAAIAYSDIRNYASWGPAGVVIKDSAQVTPQAAVAVAEVFDGPKRGKGVKLYDKLAALKMLGEYVGVFKKDAISPAAGPVIKVYAGIDPDKV